MIILQLNRKNAWQCCITGTTLRKSCAISSEAPAFSIFISLGQKLWGPKKKIRISSFGGNFIFRFFKVVIEFVSLMLLFYVLGVFLAPRHVALSSPSSKSLFSLKKKNHAWIPLQDAGKATCGIFSTILVVITVMPHVRIPEREERRLPRQCISQKGKFLADESGLLPHSGAGSESPEPTLLPKFIGCA